MKQIRNRVESIVTTNPRPPLPVPLPDLTKVSSEQLLKIRLALGADPQQVIRYADFLYLRKLGEERRYSEVVKEAARIRSKRGLSIKASRLDALEKNTFFSKDTCENLQMVEEFRARARLAGTPAAQAKVAAEFLDSRPLLTPVLDRFCGSSQDEILAGLGRLIPADGGEPKLDAIPAVAGIALEDRETTIYLRGKSTHAVDVTQFGRVRPLDPKVASSRFRIHCRRVVLKNSTGEMKLFTAIKWGDGYELELGDRRVTLTPAEFARLKKGLPLPDKHPLTQALLAQGDGASVLYSNPFLRKPGTLQRDVDSLVFALQKSYPKRRIYRDDFSPQTATRVASLNHFTTAGPQDVVAVVAEDTFGTEDGKVIQNAANKLADAGVTIETIPKSTNIQWKHAKGKALIVITGHADKALVEFVSALGRAGTFEGNYVVFNSCRTVLSRQLITEINTRYGAVATFAHDKIVDAAEIEDFTVDFAEQLKKGGGKRRFHDLLSESLRKSKLNGIWTICYIYRTFFGSRGSNG